jgi:hypothetical protein
MSGYIGSKASVTLVDGYTQADADAEFVAKAGDTMTGGLTVGGSFTSLGIDDNATSTAVTIDSAGRVTMPYQPVISGQIGTAMIDPAADQLIAFNEFWSSVGITYNPTTRRFTVPVGGKYRITLNPFFYVGVAGGRVRVGVNNDSPTGSNHYGMAYRGSTDFETGCINSVVSLSANDYVVFSLSSGKLYNRTDDKFNQFSIQLIS